MCGLALLYKLKQTTCKLFNLFKVGSDKGPAVLQIEASELPVNSEDLGKVKNYLKLHVF